MASLTCEPKLTVRANRGEIERTLAAKGYFRVPSMLSVAECERLKAHFTTLHDQRALPGYHYVDEQDANGDVLATWPRMMNPHRHDALARQTLLNPRIMRIAGEIFGETALAAQSMYYFKPPQAKGQAMHQDNFYLRSAPARCIAAWIALDAADEENGGLRVVVGTQGSALQCPGESDGETFIPDEVEYDPQAVVSTQLAAGDCLFFCGSLVHGSTPNRSNTRWRHSYICHYTTEAALAVGQPFLPLVNAEGKDIYIPANTSPGPCG